MDLRLSVSKTKTFLHCKLQYKYLYLEKLPRKEHDFHTFGKLLHKVLEDFHLAYINGSLEPYNIEMGNAFKKALQEYSGKINKEQKKEAKEIATEYLKQITANKKSGKIPTFLAAEKDFSLKIENNDSAIILNGCIDRTQIDTDGVIHVADYKTTKNKKYLQNDWFQLLTYALVLYTEDPSITKIRGSYILLRHNLESITKEFSIDEILEARESYFKYAEQILNEKEFGPSPSFLCRWCDAYNVCKSGGYSVEKDMNFGETDW